DGSVAVTARASIPAMFAQVNGFPKMSTLATTDADADAGQDLELVIAFDTTNSMGFDNTWTAAMGTLNNVLNELDQYTGSDNFYVTLVPFSDRVNIGTGNDGWLSGSAPVNWNGCVEPREVNNGTVSWALDAAKPNGANKFDASIVGVTGGLVGFSGSYPYCPGVPITGPTNNVSQVITAANAITKSGTGRFDVAMAWAWRVLAKKWRTEWPNMHNSFAQDKERRQIAIMVTDGKTEAYSWEVDQVSSWGWNNGSVGGFENMVAVCDGMKAENIELFMVRVNGNANATGYMQDCASSDDHYYEISSNAELELAFEEVLKVVKTNVRLTR
ncbi:MAG: VWA domain-containing protein, partial [Acidimicrobiales bacterium]